eukprot:c20151_g2_i1 orf=49-297(-)
MIQMDCSKYLWKFLAILFLNSCEGCSKTKYYLQRLYLRFQSCITTVHDGLSITHLFAAMYHNSACWVVCYSPICKDIFLILQ